MPSPRVSLLEFLRTGKFGGVSLGANISEVKAIFGEPQFIKTGSYGDPICTWDYWNIRFGYNTESQKVYTISIEVFHDEDHLDNHGHIRKRFPLDVGIFGVESDFEGTKKALHSAKLHFQQISNEPTSEYETLRLDSGAEFVFRRDLFPNGLELVLEVLHIYSKEIVTNSPYYSNLENS